MGKYVSLCIYAYPFKHISSFHFHDSSFSWCRYSLSEFCSCYPLLLLFALSSFGLFFHYLLSLHVLISISSKFFSVISVCSFSLFVLFWVDLFFPSLFLSVARRSYRSRCFPPSFLFFFLFVST